MASAWRPDGEIFAAIFGENALDCLVIGQPGGPRLGGRRAHGFDVKGLLPQHVMNVLTRGMILRLGIVDGRVILH